MKNVEQPVFNQTLDQDARIPLGSGVAIQIPLDGRPVEAGLDIYASRDHPGADSPKALVAAVTFSAEDGTSLQAPSGWYISRHFGAFRYVSGLSPTVVSISPPPTARTVTLTLAPWATTGNGVTVRNGVRLARHSGANGLAGEQVLPVPAALDFAPTSTDEWLALWTATSPVTLPVIGGQDYFLDLRLKTLKRIEDGGKGPRALLDVTWYDRDGLPVESRGTISHNSRIGEYRYVRHADGRPNLLLLQPPLQAVRGVLRLHPWGGARGDVSFQRRAVLTFRGLHTRAAAKRSSARRAETLRVAMICDEFTFNSFAPEFELITLSPGNWREELEGAQPDLFLCESAWAGPDSSARVWRGRVYASVNFPRENRAELFGILEYCRANGIPTAFWNKEDPSHYEDRRHDFVRTALLFDHVFTTAAECVERYVVDYGHQSVHCLPFATQPRLFNPVSTDDRTDEVIFAGSWYNQHPDRGVAMSRIFDTVVSAGRDLVIFNRHHGDDDPNHLFPEKYSQHLRPSVSHREMASLYKRSRFGLNINTETRSRTMFARRVFELMSSNTLVLSNYSAGMDAMFGDSVVFVDRDPERLAALTDADVDRIRETALREVLAHHTYRNRFLRILDAVGIPYARGEERPTLATVVANEAEAEAAVRSFAFLSSAAEGLLLVLARDIPALDVRRLYRQFNRGAVKVVDQRLVADGSGLGLGLAFDRIVLTTALEQLTPEMLRDVRLHSTYMEGPMVFTTDPAQRYRLRDAHPTGSEHTVVKAAELADVLAGTADNATQYYSI